MKERRKETRHGGEERMKSRKKDHHKDRTPAATTMLRINKEDSKQRLRSREGKGLDGKGREGKVCKGRRGRKEGRGFARAFRKRVILFATFQRNGTREGVRGGGGREGGKK